MGEEPGKAAAEAEDVFRTPKRPRQSALYGVDPNSPMLSIPSPGPASAARLRDAPGSVRGPRAAVEAGGPEMAPPCQLDRIVFSPTRPLAALPEFAFQRTVDVDVQKRPPKAARAARERSEQGSGAGAASPLRVRIVAAAGCSRPTSELGAQLAAPRTLQTAPTELAQPSGPSGTDAAPSADLKLLGLLRGASGGHAWRACGPPEDASDAVLRGAPGDQTGAQRHEDEAQELVPRQPGNAPPSDRQGAPQALPPDSASDSVPPEYAELDALFGGLLEVWPIIVGRGMQRRTLAGVADSIQRHVGRKCHAREVYSMTQLLPQHLSVSRTAAPAAAAPSDAARSAAQADAGAAVGAAVLSVTSPREALGGTGATNRRLSAADVALLRAAMRRAMNDAARGPHGHGPAATAKHPPHPDSAPSADAARRRDASAAPAAHDTAGAAPAQPSGGRGAPQNHASQPALAIAVSDGLRAGVRGMLERERVATEEARPDSVRARTSQRALSSLLRAFDVLWGIVGPTGRCARPRAELEREMREASARRGQPTEAAEVAAHLDLLLALAPEWVSVVHSKVLGRDLVRVSRKVNPTVVRKRVAEAAARRGPPT